MSIDFPIKPEAARPLGRAATGEVSEAAGPASERAQGGLGGCDTSRWV